MKRICVTIEYVGTRYSGWQKQDGLITVQGEIEDAIKRVFGQTVEVFGSGRTDKGVHALSQHAHFDLPDSVPVEKIKDLLNSALPEDIFITKVEEKEKDFHARFSLKKKVYLYKICNACRQSAFDSWKYAFISQKLSLEKMQLVANKLVGKHDFRGFSSSKTQSKDFAREIYSITLNKKGDIIEIEVSGNGFLYNMVRIIVGTMVDFSLGKITLDDVTQAIEKGDRSHAGRTMPASGLYLKDAIY